MGFEPKRTLHKLDFSETEYAGLEVVTRPVPLQVLLEFIDLADSIDPAKPDLGKVRAIFERFSGVLVEWNVTSDGQPVPASYDGLKSQDLEFVLAVIMAWITSVSQAPPPLRSASGTGSTMEASIPMSPSPAS